MFRLLAALLAAVLALTACGGGGDDDVASDDAASDDTESDSTASDGFEYESPLGEFLGWSTADFDAEDEQARFEEQERQVQEQIAECMREQGFEYIPIDTSAQRAFFEDLEDGLEWGSKEWTEKWGFGVTTQRFSQNQVGPDLVGHTWDSFDQEGPPDPNREYVESLSEDEQQAYYEALYGGEDDSPIPIWEEEGREPTDEELAAFEEEWLENYQPTGCEPVAYEEIFDFGDEGDWQRFDEEFGEALMELETRFESHPDVIAHRDEVRACVEDKGVEYLSQEEAWEHFDAELNAAGLGWMDEPDPLEGIDTTNFTDEDYEQAYREFQNRPLADDKLVALAELQQIEIETALALYDCGGGWEQEQQVLADVRIELEEEFLAANADRLAEFEGVFGN